jgi:hypothetical protein
MCSDLAERIYPEGVPLDDAKTHAEDTAEA